ncbi:MAG: hypothetical protein HYY08_01995 [Firmicutes bacterium]|nr:hypothetical protein [Bacillota bacterium]
MVRRIGIAAAVLVLVVLFSGVVAAGNYVAGLWEPGEVTIVGLEGELQLSPELSVRGSYKTAGIASVSRLALRYSLGQTETSSWGVEVGTGAVSVLILSVSAYTIGLYSSTEVGQGLSLHGRAVYAFIPNAGGTWVAEGEARKQLSDKFFLLGRLTFSEGTSGTTVGLGTTF